MHKSKPTEASLRGDGVMALVAGYWRAIAEFERADSGPESDEFLGGWDVFLKELAQRSPADVREAYEMQAAALNSRKMGEWTDFVEKDFLDASCCILQRVADALKLWSATGVTLPT